MPFQYGANRCKIVSSFQRVEIVRSLAQIEARRSKLIEPFVIAQAHPAPVIALE